MSDWIDVAKVGEIASGGHKIVDANGTHIAVFNIDGEHYALEDVCTHDGGELAGGCVVGDEIECLRHGARFSIRTGEVTNPPAYVPVTKFPVRVENGVVQVRDDRWD